MKNRSDSAGLAAQRVRCRAARRAAQLSVAARAQHAARVASMSRSCRRRRAARRRVHVRQRPLLPRQADLRAAFRAPPDPTIRSSAAASTSSRRTRGCESPDTRVTRAAIRDSPTATSISTNRRYRRPLERSATSLLARDRPRLRRGAARQHRVAQVRRRARRDLRRAPAVPGRLRRPRRHEPRRPAAAAGAPTASSWTTCRSPAPSGTVRDRRSSPRQCREADTTDDPAGRRQRRARRGREATSA